MAGDTHTPAHALLGPSGASKWLNCPPSARLAEGLPNKSSEAADEGTLAHSLGELIIQHLMKRILAKQYREELALLKLNEYYSKLMHEYAEGYATFCIERYNGLGHTRKLEVETKLFMSKWVPEGSGRGDFAAYDETVLEIVDLKYGKGVKVSAQNSPQLKLYALGWLTELGDMHDFQTVRMTIYQPRMDNIDTFEMSVKDLLHWAETDLKTGAQLAWEGKGEYKAGAHCTFCRARTTCKVYADMQLEAARATFQDVIDEEAIDGEITLPELPLMSLDEIAFVLRKGEGLANWVKGIQEHALKLALTGVEIPGFKLIRPEGKRFITDKEAVAKVLIKDGFDRTKLYKPQELYGITELEKLTGKKDFDKLLGAYVKKADGSPALADKDDPRATFVLKPDAQQEFEGIETEY